MVDDWTQWKENGTMDVVSAAHNRTNMSSHAVSSFSPLELCRFVSYVHFGRDSLNHTDGVGTLRFSVALVVWTHSFSPTSRGEKNK